MIKMEKYFDIFIYMYKFTVAVCCRTLLELLKEHRSSMEFFSSGGAHS